MQFLDGMPLWLILVLTVLGQLVFIEFGFRLGRVRQGKPNKAQMAQAANRLGLTVSTDLNYRKNLWKYGKEPSDIPFRLEAGDLGIFMGKLKTFDIEMVETGDLLTLYEKVMEWTLTENDQADRTVAAGQDRLVDLQHSANILAFDQLS